ncbi:MAG: putative bifunctional diguanylate cyclase/phosphodiesterase, partial [Angustibacter sp.]
PREPLVNKPPDSGRQSRITKSPKRSLWPSVVFSEFYLLAVSLLACGGAPELFAVPIQDDAMMALRSASSSHSMRRLARGHLALTTVAVLAYASSIRVWVSILCFGLASLSTGLAIFWGRRIYHPEYQVPWRNLQIACLLFMVDPALPTVNVTIAGFLIYLPDLLLIPGYLLLLCTCFQLLRRRGGAYGGAILDVGIILVGAVVFSLTYLMFPLLSGTALSPWSAVLTATYPVLDLGMFALLALYWMTSQDRSPALLLLNSAFGFFLIGDIAYNLLALSGTFDEPAIFDVPYIIALGLIAQSALHPSMAGLGLHQAQRIQPWSRGRMALLCPALLVPAWLILQSPTAPLQVRFLQASGVAVMAIAMLLRARGAVAEHAAMHRTFETLATRDPLTGLANRMALRQDLQRRILLGEAMNVLFLDIDNFKIVNDSWGHAVGDELLTQVAARLRLLLPTGVLLARTGGDEFVIVAQTQMAGRTGGELASLVIAELTRPYHLSVGEVTVTTSVGLTSTDSGVFDGRAEVDTLVREADTAMYHAKEFGRDRSAIYHESMGAAVRERAELDRALRQALVQGEISVVFQPIVQLSSQAIVGFEALARWRRAGDQHCEPGVFIPAAEESGLIIPIGDFVLSAALDAFEEWQRLRPGMVSLNVNISGRQLLDHRFADRVLKELSDRRLSSAGLRFEITESTLISNEPVAVETLRKLDLAGISISVDDFGTGYSSLSYLSRLRVHEIKVDREFVNGVVSRAEDQAIVRATVAMAQALGFTVVAEGIETSDQRELLMDLQIERGQGWILGRPLAASAAAAAVRGTPPPKSAA